MLAFGPTHPYIAAEIYSSISTKAEQFPALCASVIPQQSLSSRRSSTKRARHTMNTRLVSKVINQDRYPLLSTAAMNCRRSRGWHELAASHRTFL